MGNAERLAYRHGNDLRYCYEWGCWLIWNGNRWEVDAQGLQLQFGQRVTNISTSSTQSSSTALMTASAIQSAISAGGGGVALGDNPF